MPSALTITFVQSTVLNAISNILAQLIDQRNNTVNLLPCPTNLNPILHIYQNQREFDLGKREYK